MPIDYSIAAIPTEYRGIRYRSRLEAKWAAFFTLADWSFQYEPADLGEWSPDFQIFRGELPCLVEVKPLTQFDPDIAARMYRAARAANFSGHLILLRTAPVGSIAGWVFGDAMPRTFPIYWEFEPFGDGIIGAEELADIWAKATNAVQWIPGSKR